MKTRSRSLKMYQNSVLLIRPANPLLENDVSPLDGGMETDRAVIRQCYRGKEDSQSTGAALQRLGGDACVALCFDVPDIKRATQVSRLRAPVALP
jgi:hypothetical protein